MGDQFFTRPDGTMFDAYSAAMDAAILGAYERTGPHDPLWSDRWPDGIPPELRMRLAREVGPIVEDVLVAVLDTIRECGEIDVDRAER